jgi:HlyD family secretion protein
MANDQAQQRAKRVRIVWITAGVIAVILIGLSMIPESIEADLVTVDRGDVRTEVVDEGRTRMHDVYLISAPVTGRVLRVEVEPGDEVQAGEAVARMSNTAAGFLDARSALQAQAAVRAAEAQERSAAAQFALAESEHRRNLGLVADKVISQSAADESQTRFDAARAALEAARAEVARARSALLQADRTGSDLIAVTTPSPGRVLRVPQESEAVIAAGTPIVEIGDPNHVEVIAEFLSQEAVRMKVGAPAMIENWGGAALPAKVERIEPVARTEISALGVEEQRTNVILQFDSQPEGALQAHDYRVDARVVIDEAKNAVRVPLGALFRRSEQWALYKVVDDRATLTEVTVAQSDDRYRAVTSGVVEGDTVIVFPGNAIKDGVKVKAREAAVD